MANETKWSAAPWSIGRGDRKADGAKIYVRCARRIDGAPAGIAVAHVLAAPGRDEQLANADLINAAPALHDALAVFVLDRRLRAWLEEHDPKALEQATAALVAAGSPIAAGHDGCDACMAGIDGVGEPCSACRPAAEGR